MFEEEASALSTSGHAHSMDQIVDPGDHRGDSAKELVPRRVLIELDVRRSQTLIDDIHDLRDQVKDFRVLRSRISNRKVIETGKDNTYLWVNVLQD